ncbi:unnamed protein product [Adineta steineri]|uniref:Uncharacterized protein n=1 Tax=Adineta steineri TaxID=433720 RepID=A0A815EMX1_9BILA|nr:unnamed protein product [Adineta steineri]CAF1317412.1 unnamed protein product [Adineta steineri]CAF3554580.1 unnamed protein product [Adineta steineri]CAF3586930.1 unnamed protein product [Adineta steineri]
MSLMSNKRFSTRLGPQVKSESQEKKQNATESKQHASLELNKDKDYILPFAQRIIKIDSTIDNKVQKESLSIIIKNNQPSTLSKDIRLTQQTDFIIIDKRNNCKYDDDDNEMVKEEKITNNIIDDFEKFLWIDDVPAEAEEFVFL